MHDLGPNFGPKFEEWMRGKFTDITSEFPVVITIPDLIRLCAKAYLLGKEE